MSIYKLFPEPVYFSNLERTLTKTELKTIAQFKKNTYKNIGNITTHDTYILEHETLKQLKKDLYTMVVDYFNKIICTSDDITPYITQSWISYTELNEQHHRHAHSNSYISGVFYIDARREVDKIKFFKDKYTRLELSTKKHNPFNSTNWWFPVETGDVILFPSYLVHGVDPNQGINARTSLAFNIFIKGKMGSKLDLTELTL